MKILVVDDNNDDRTMLRRVLEVHGHEVITAANGQEGLQAVSARTPDLIVSDMLMPVMDGYEFLRNLRKSYSVPFVFYSAVYNGNRDMELAAALGADGYLFKPKDPVELLEEIERIAGKQPQDISETVAEDSEYLRRYSQVVVSKLEEKVRELQETLAERTATEQRISSFFANAPGYFYTLVRWPDGTVAMPFASNGLIDLCGLWPTDVAGDLSLFTAIIHPDDIEPTFMHMEESARTMSPFHMEYRINHPKKGERWIEARSMPQHEPDGSTLWHGFMHDITERKRTEEVLQFIAQRGWTEGREYFFPALVRYLGKMFDVDYVIIDKISRDHGAETVALYAQGAIVPNMRYDLAGTPCDNVMGKSLCIYPSGVQQLFPDDTLLRDMNVDSYIGLPLWDFEGKPIGLIAVMDSAPLDDPAAITGVLQLLATRAAAELEWKRSEEALRAKQQRLSDVTVELSLAGERERRCIATELHDNIGQDLVLAKIKLGMLTKTSLSETETGILDKTREILGDMIQRVRLLTHMISPPILESGGLEAALKWLGRQIESDYGLRVAFADDAREKMVTEEVRSVLYHAVRELLINIAKHAQSSTARIAVAREGNGIVISVEDDGVGFDPQNTIEESLTREGSGFGLFNIRRRIIHLGGTFEIESAPNAGTRVTIGMPLQLKNEA